MANMKICDICGREKKQVQYTGEVIISFTREHAKKEAMKAMKGWWTFEFYPTRNKSYVAYNLDICPACTDRVCDVLHLGIKTTEHDDKDAEAYTNIERELMNPEGEPA